MFGTLDTADMSTEPYLTWLGPMDNNWDAAAVHVTKLCDVVGNCVRLSGAGE